MSQVNINMREADLPRQIVEDPLYAAFANMQVAVLLQGSTPLHCAVAHGQMQAAHMLITKGASPDLVSHQVPHAGNLLWRYTLPCISSLPCV